jgi:cupin fold WbuC family metalloprotein
MAEIMKTIDPLLFESISASAKTNPRLRQHHNFHESLDEPCNRLLIAMEPGSYLQPHRHLSYPKPELFVALRGTLVVLTFSDAGNIENTYMLSPKRETMGVEVAPGTWHSAVSLEEGSVFLEVKPGPYKSLPDEDKAPWAPAEGAPGSVDYYTKLSAQVRSLCTIKQAS